MEKTSLPSTADPVSPSAGEVLEGLRRYLEGKEGIKQIARSLDMSFPVFRNMLRQAYRNGYVVITPPENSASAERLLSIGRKVRYHVLDAQGDLFFRYSRDVFLRELADLLQKRCNDKPLCIGVVSGRTSGGMVESICDINETWEPHINAKLLPPEIHIYALNVSQTDGYDQLKGNANILAYQLAHRFQDVAARSKVEAFGLSATLLQSQEERRKTDCSKVMSKLLAKTDPKRLKDSLEAMEMEIPNDLPDQSQLDMIITGVGSPKDSFFAEYCHANGVELAHPPIAGDIAYNPVDSIGQPQQLQNKHNTIIEFYCAVSLDVLREMSSDPSKRVIVVARVSEESKKTDIIHAAIYGNSPLCNVLITDTKTAHGVYVTFKQ